MNSYYLINAVFPAALDEAVQSLIELQKNIERYKLKKNANQDWIDKQEEYLAKLMYFIETSEASIEQLKEAQQEVKQEGFRKGLEQAKKQYEHQKEFGGLQFDIPNHREQIRAATILNAQEKWNF